MSDCKHCEGRGWVQTRYYQARYIETCKECRDFVGNAAQTTALVAHLARTHAWLLTLLQEAVREYDEHGPNVVDVDWLKRARSAIAIAEGGAE